MSAIPGPIPDYIKKNFSTMSRACRNGDLAVLSATRKGTDEPVSLICGVVHERDGSTRLVPFGEMCMGDPYEMYNDPVEDVNA